MNEEYINKLLDCLVNTEDSILITLGWGCYYADVLHLSDKDKMALVLMLYNMNEYGCKKKHFKKIFPSWTDYKIKKMAKELNARVVTLWNNYGHLCGKGYMFDWEDVKKFKHNYQLRFNIN